MMQKIIAPIGVAVLLLSVWELAVRSLHIDPIVLPLPSAVGQVLIAQSSELGVNTGLTLVEAASGFLIGSAGAFLLGMLFVYSAIAERSLYPYAIALKSTPLVAIAPLLVLWFGDGLGGKIVMAALVAFFPVLVSSVRGLRDIDPVLHQLLRSLALTERQILFRVRIRTSLPYVLSSLKIASTLAVVGAVIGEFAGANRGIGYLIKLGAYNLDTALTIAGVFCIAIGSVVFFTLVSLLEKYLVFWREPL